jgi:hypothetical protein
MSTELESTIVNLLALREKAVGKLIESSVSVITQVRDKCLHAERQEGDVSLNWRRSSGPPKDRGGGGGGVQNRWRGSGQAARTAMPSVAKPAQGTYVGRYVSKFNNQESPVEDKILNQVILNKLNKFSSANYDEIKSFLQQILDSNEKEFLQSFMLLVFKKAAAEPTFCGLYARMIGELSLEYKTLRDEMELLYTTYLTIFEEVSETETSSYETFVQRNREKIHRLGYSQFLAELTSLGVLEQEQLERLYTTILTQIRLHSSKDDSKQQLVDEYIDCLLRMTRAFQKKQSPKLLQIRQGLSKTCEESMTDILANKSTKFPGISKKAGFALMDCLDIFRGTHA